MRTKISKKGFTLVELLAVIVILSLLTVIAVPSTMAISRRIRTNMLETKLDFAVKQAVIWAQDHRSCFTGHTNNCDPGTFVGPCTPSDEGATGGAEKTCIITLQSMAEMGYYEWDDEINKTIENPLHSNQCLNRYTVTLVYNSRTRNFRANINTPDPGNVHYHQCS